MVEPMRSYVCAVLAAMAVSGSALAQGIPEPVAPTKFGVGLDVGFPDGAVLSALWQPTSLIRASVGGAYNLLSPGIRAGVTLTPFQLMINPSLSVEAGHFFTSSSDSVLGAWIGSSGVAASTFKDVSYNYGTVELGVEFGGVHVGGFFHLGMSYVDATVHNFQQHLQEQNATDSGTLEASDPSLRGFFPSAKLGLLFFF
jgi:hypothetical protein